MARTGIKILFIKKLKNAMAHTLKPQHPLPLLTIDDKGLLEYHDNQFTYHPWSSNQLTGKVYLIHAIAGRTSAQQMNDPLMEAIKAASFPESAFQVVTIINTNDALIGTSGFVRATIESNKKQHPEAAFVVDRKGKMLSAWPLAKRSSAIILLDAQGHVQFAKEGALSRDEVDSVINLIQHQIS